MAVTKVKYKKKCFFNS